MMFRITPVVLFCVGLAGCAVVPEAPEIPMQDLRLRQPGGELIAITSLFDAVNTQSLPQGRGTPEGIISRKDLGPALDWLASHDANGDGYLYTSELNAAWVLLAAWAVSGRPYEASRLTDAAGVTVGTLSLSADDRQRLSRIIEADPATARLLSEARLRLGLAREKRMTTQSLFIGPLF